MQDYRDKNTAEVSAEKTTRILFLLVLFAALVLRLAWLGRASYTIDESNAVNIALSYKSVGDLIRTEMERFTSLHRLPLPLIVLRSMAAWTKWETPVPPEWTTRLPMALIGVLTVALMSWWGAVFSNRRLGLWASGLCSISFFAVFYSREAYDYSLVMFFSAGTLLFSTWLVRESVEKDRPSLCVVIGFVLFAAGLLQVHLTGLLFIAPLWGFMGMLLLWRKGVAYFLKGNAPLRWLAIWGLPFVPFLPFMLKLGQFSVTEPGVVKRFSLAVLPAIWGRMGWGESPLPLAALVLLWGWGCWYALRQRSPAHKTAGQLGVLAMFAYFTLQSWMLRVSRFEVRYYTPFFPALLLFTAFGIVAAEDAVARKFSEVWAKRARGAFLVALLLWSAPSLWWILRMECRGFANFKGIAQWINQNVPEGGIYAFLNVYDLRGVPQTYPTPGRAGTCVAYWSSAEEHMRANPPERTRHMLRQIPTVHLIEIAPYDILVPQIAKPADYIPRKEIFARSIWLEDAAYRSLVEWQTLPLGNAQWNTTNEHRVLISYNRPEDLPELTRRQGRHLYHYYTPEWRYARDQSGQDWMVTASHAAIRLGNVEENVLTVRPRIVAAGLPGSCLLNVFAGPTKIVDKQRVPAEPTRLTLPLIQLAPGEMPLLFEVLPAAGAWNAQFGINLVEWEIVGAQH